MDLCPPDVFCGGNSQAKAHWSYEKSSGGSLGLAVEGSYSHISLRFTNKTHSGFCPVPVTEPVTAGSLQAAKASHSFILHMLHGRTQPFKTPYISQVTSNKPQL